MNRVSLNASKFLMFILLALSSFAFAGEMTDKYEQKNIEAKKYLEEKRKMSLMTENEAKEYTLSKKIIFSILGLVFFFIIPLFVPFILLFLAFKNNKEFKEMFFWFSLFKAFKS